jgi:hypothetical protein
MWFDVGASAFARAGAERKCLMVLANIPSEKFWSLPILHERGARAYIALGISHIKASRFLSGSRKNVIQRS